MGTSFALQNASVTLYAIWTILQQGIIYTFPRTNEIWRSWSTYEMALTLHLTLIRVYEQSNRGYYYRGTDYLKITIKHDMFHPHMAIFRGIQLQKETLYESIKIDMNYIKEISTHTYKYLKC